MDARRTLRRPRGRLLAALAVAGLVGVSGCARVRALSDDPHRVILDGAAGLRVGDPVRMAGVEIGRVMSLEHRHAEAVIQIRVTPGTPVFADACAVVEPSSSFGPRHLVVKPGTPATGPLAPGGAAKPCVDALDLPDVLNQMLPILEGDEGPSFDDTVRSLRLANGLLRLLFGDEDKAPDPVGAADRVAKTMREWSHGLSEFQVDMDEGVEGLVLWLVKGAIPARLEAIDRSLERLEADVPAGFDRWEARLVDVERKLDAALADDRVVARQEALRDAVKVVADMRAFVDDLPKIDPELASTLDDAIKGLRAAKEYDEKAIRELLQVEGTRSNFDSISDEVREAFERDGIPLDEPGWKGGD
ncbi:MAG: MCE family protein [Myxococcales bacterium]|nr:MCE family protein [Myxococcales bacterium]